MKMMKNATHVLRSAAPPGKLKKSSTKPPPPQSKLEALPPMDLNRTPARGWRPWVYLASGLGFSARERALVLPELVAALEAAGARVFEPFMDNAEGAKTAATQGPGWAHRIGAADVEAVRRCDAVFCCANANPPDEGAMVELGIAIGLRKPTFVYRDDFRTCTATEEYPLNLMLFSGMPASTWRDYFYTSLEDIASPDKAFARWVSGEDVRPLSWRGDAAAAARATLPPSAKSLTRAKRMGTGGASSAARALERGGAVLAVVDIDGDAS